MPLVRTALIATAACLIGAAAYAQPTAGDTSSTSPAQQAPADQSATPPADQSAMPPAADQSAMPPASSGMNQAAPTGAAANTSTTVGANGNQVIASQPVPDTPANRAAYGKPL
ncbi:MAG TPA: hypothetical protein VFE13_19835, partial [Caulobacteraceae bacterium]|nr:hypothetical protein [Caulobacteraceae bacterium]